jgi:hypothetical protein
MPDPLTCSPKNTSSSFSRNESGAVDGVTVGDGGEVAGTGVGGIVVLVSTVEVGCEELLAGGFASSHAVIITKNSISPTTNLAFFHPTAIHLNWNRFTI